MKYICSWSGGKDSTASIILAHEKNEPLDTIIFSEVMFDKNISGENPRHIDFIKNKAKPLFESWGYEVIILRSEKTYMDIFNHVIEKPRKHLSHKGQKYGFAVTGLCSVKRDLKLKPIEKYYKALGKTPYMQYVGICIDEPKRLTSLHKDKTKISILEKYEYTEQMAKELCEKYNLLSPCYELSKRGGCWFCPNAKFEEHKQIRELYPDVWDRFVALEKEQNLANNKWNVYGQTLMERDEILKKQEECYMVGSVYYAAIKTLKKCIGKNENGKYQYVDISEAEQKTWAAVFLTSTNNKDYYNFSYKDMNETVGPGCYDCPESILKLLDETDSEYALNWRKECHQRNLEKKSPDALPKLPVGSIISFIAPFTSNAAKKGDEVTLQKNCRINGKSYWSGNGYKWSVRLIPKTYTVVSRGF